MYLLQGAAQGTVSPRKPNWFNLCVCTRAGTHTLELFLQNNSYICKDPQVGGSWELRINVFMQFVFLQLCATSRKTESVPTDEIDGF